MHTKYKLWIPQSLTIFYFLCVFISLNRRNRENYKWRDPNSYLFNMWSKYAGL